VIILFSLPFQKVCYIYIRVSTTPGNTGNILEFRWSSSKFLSDGTITKTSSHKKLTPVKLFGRWWWWLCISHHGCIYLV